MEIKDKLLLTPKDFKPSHRGWKVEGVLNPGGERLPDGRIVLLVRVAESADHSHGKGQVCPVISSDKSLVPSSQPCLY